MTTAALTDAPDRSRRWRWDRTRAALAEAARQGTKMVSAVRHRDRSPALTISGLASLDVSAWETFGRGAAWAALGISILLYDVDRERRAAARRERTR